MDQEVEEVSFLPGEAILNKKAVYEPTKGQRFRQVVCSRGWAICILLTMGTVMVAISVIAAFARPAAMFSGSQCGSDVNNSLTPGSDTDASSQEEPQTYIATNGEPFPWKDIRLPKHVVPDSYSIFLHANISQSFFTGKVRMALKIVEDTDFIIFHSVDLNVTNIKISEEGDDDEDDGQELLEVEILKILEYPRNEMFYVKTASVMEAGMQVQLEADFRGSLASLSQMKGFYKSRYLVNGEERFMASTQFQATDARRAFPCLDEPQLKAKFSMSLVRDKNHITLFNTPLKRNGTYTGDLILDEYEETVKMSTYLVAFVVCDFKNLSKTTAGGVTVHVFAPEDKIYMGQYALDAAVAVLDYYNSFFGVPYPLPKQDLIAIPNFAAGAMENWGLITYRDTAVLYDADVSTEQQKKWVATVVAHELAHQWFGNLVTMEWWNDLWLNEGFATFVENIGADVVDKDFHMMDAYMSSFFGAQYLDSLASSHPISMPVHDPVEIEAVFDQISYDKGSALIRMLESVLGSDQFKSGLTSYLKKHAYANADTMDLWDAFQDASTLPSDLTVAKVMDTWTKQMNYPVVTVTRKQEKLILTQERFLLRDGSHDNSKEKSESPFGYKWHIPFTFTTSTHSDQQTLVWMKMGSTQVDLEDAGQIRWLKGNVQTLGFYRVNYDKAGWQALISQLLKDHTVFTVADRMGIIDDAFSLARAGLIDYTVPLDITRYLINETDYFVWDTALSHIGFLKERLYLTEEYDLLTSYVLSLAKPLIDAQGWESKENHLQENMQALMIGQGVSFEYQPVVDKALEIFKQWENNESMKMSNGLRSIIYGAGIKYGKKRDWDLVFERYKKSVIPSEVEILLGSLSEPSDARVLQILLEYSLDDSKIKSQDTGTVLRHVAANDNGRLLSWRFLRENWDTIYERYGDGSFILSGVVKGVTALFNTQFDYDEITAFFANKKLGSAKMALDQSLEVIQSHIEWAQVNLAVVKKWLIKSVPPNMEIM